MSFQATAWALKQRVGDPTAKMVLLAVCNYVGADGVCFAKQSTLAYDSEVSDRTIRRALSKLVELGLIRITDRRSNGNRQATSEIRLVWDQSSEEFSPPDVPPDSLSDGEPVDTAMSGPSGHKVSAQEQLFKQVQDNITRASPSSDWPKDYQVQFWEFYPVKRGKGDALRKLDGLRKSGRVPWQDLINGLRRMLEALRAGWIEEKYIKHPSTWLNQGCWEDIYSAPTGRLSGRSSRTTFDDVIAEAEREFHGRK